MLTDWRPYLGDHRVSTFEDLPCQQWRPADAHGNVRAVALDGWAQPPSRIAGWLRVDEAEPANDWDGLHVMLMAGNHHNLVISLARADGVTVVSRQWGDGRYDDLARTEDGLKVDPGYVFSFELDWHSGDQLTLCVGTSWRGTVRLKAEIPTTGTGGEMEGRALPQLTAGLIGVRFDRMSVRGQIGKASKLSG